MQIPNFWSMTDFFDYLIDAYQRYIIFLNVLKQRGDEQEAISNNTYATVLDFEYQIILSGSSFSRPINYYLGRIAVSDETAKNQKAPIIVVDPRAGQGPGISGFKPQSEIGMAISQGYPVYLIGFTATPIPGQTFLDVLDGQVECVACRLFNVVC